MSYAPLPRCIRSSCGAHAGALLILFSAAPALVAQSVDGDDGPLLQPPGLLSVAASTPGPGGQVLAKVAAFQLTYPLDATGLVDFSEGALLGGATGLDIDALSVGLDWIATDGTGRVTLASPTPWSWAAMIVSPARNPSVGLPRHPRIASEALRVDGVGADLFSVILKGSVLPGYPPITSARVDLAADSTEINLFLGTPAELDAYDLLAVAYLTDYPFLPPPVAFFSVSDASVPVIPPHWSGTRSGATIFMTSWIGGSWTTPTEHRSPADLGLSPLNDIDALSVDLYHNPAIYYVFSLVPDFGPGSSPASAGTSLSWARHDTVGRTVFRYADGATVADDIGRGTNPTAVCLLDPGRDSILAALMGRPGRPPFTPWPSGTARSSAWIERHPQQPGDHFISVLLSEPCSILGSRNDALLSLWLPGYSAVMGPVTIPSMQRGGGLGSGYWRGCPATVSVPLPTGLYGSGIAVTCFWLDLAPGGNYSLALPKEIVF
ncbi:MAG: hypothetical protein IPM29_22185 [Planctomycetes bacterium]|nr:hypothetical protein [Planctomycetota bacterium]